MFDYWLLHCGMANQLMFLLALFYFSFKSPEVGCMGNLVSIRIELGDSKVTLGALMEDLESFGKGKGTPLIDKLGTMMR